MKKQLLMTKMYKLIDGKDELVSVTKYNNKNQIKDEIHLYYDFLNANNGKILKFKNKLKNIGPFSFEYDDNGEFISFSITVFKKRIFEKSSDGYLILFYNTKGYLTRYISSISGVKGDHTINRTNIRGYIIRTNIFDNINKKIVTVYSDLKFDKDGNHFQFFKNIESETCGKISDENILYFKDNEAKDEIKYKYDRYGNCIYIEIKKGKKIEKYTIKNYYKI